MGGDARCLMAGWWSGKILRASCLVSSENHNSVTAMLCRGGECRGGMASRVRFWAAYTLVYPQSTLKV